MSCEPWNISEGSDTYNNKSMREVVRGVTYKLTQVTGGMGVALLVYMSMLRRDYRESQKDREM